MSFKNHINSKFASCRLLAETFDIHRNREVRVYLMPGEFTAVGVTDGVDAWIAPTIINPFSCNVQDILRRIQAGEDVPVFRTSPTGRIVPTNQKPEMQELPRRRRLLQDAPQQRRKLLHTDSVVQPSTRRRLNASS